MENKVPGHTTAPCSLGMGLPRDQPADVGNGPINEYKLLSIHFHAALTPNINEREVSWFLCGQVSRYPF